VIEDTESSIELATHGWSLLNYPERLSYSATPPHFGSLCMQRHRWANGGLLIVPKLWRLVRQRRARGERTTIGEFVLRVNYMASIFWCSLALLVLLAYHANGAQLSPFVLAIAAPYFLTMALDLRYCGYKALDVVRIYAFNLLLLLPVNLSGALASIVQGLTGSKGRFRRTPKVRSRTTPGLIYVCCCPTGSSCLPSTRACTPTRCTAGPTRHLPPSTPSSRATRSSRSWGCATRSSTSG
jgi:cellulose synthase/poly-beta-1,6-N-acetylglucosamine synthase-like glycosyltransferase